MAIGRNFKGITIQFGADTTALNKALKTIQSDSKSVQLELNKVNKALKLDPKNTELLTQKQSLLKEAIAQTTKKLDSLKQAQDKVNKAHAANPAWEKKYAPLQEKLESTAKKMKQLGSQEEEMKKKLSEGKISTEEYDKYQAELQEVTQEHKNLVKSKQELEKSFEYGHISDQEYREYNRAVMDTESKLKSLNLQLAEVSSKAVLSGEKLEQAGSKMKNSGDKLNSVGNKLTIGVTAPITAIGAYAVKSAMDFESAWTGVTKTADGTAQQMDTLRQGIINMSEELPASTTEISEVEEAAGQLGIQTDNILGFTRTMIDLGEATNLSASEGASSLAQFANITGMSQKDFDKLGSTIVALGNNFATTEADITAMGLNLAAAGSQVGMSEAQIMGFATALSSVGIEAQAGGTAFSKVMTNMQLAVERGGEDLNQFASVAGMSADEFKAAFEQDAAGAIIQFIQGLSTCEERGQSAISVLDSMGITESRMRDALLRAAGASDVFTNAIDMGTNAWNENIALTQEADKRYGTTASKIEIAKNKLKNSAASIGESLLPTLSKLAEGLANITKCFSNLNEGAKTNILRFAGVAAAVGPVTKALGKTTSAVGSLTSGIGGLIKDCGKLSSLKKAQEAISGVGSFSAKSADGVSGLSKALFTLASPTGIAVGASAALIGIGTAAVIAYQKVQKAKIEEKFGSINLSAEEVEDTTKRLTSTDWTMKLNAYIDAKNDLKNFEGKINDTVEQINKLNWKVSIGMQLTDNEKDSYKDSIKNYVDTAVEYAESQHYAVSLALQVGFDPGSATYSRLSDFTNRYFMESENELKSLGEQLSDLVNKAFEENAFDKYSPDIQKIQEKIAEKMKEISDAEHKATISNFELELETSNLSLDKESFDKVNEKIDEQVDKVQESANETNAVIVQQLEAEYDANIKAGMPEETAKKIHDESVDELQLNLNNQKADVVLKGFDFSFGEIEKNFKSDLDTTLPNMNNAMDDFTKGIVDKAQSGSEQISNTLSGVYQVSLSNGRNKLSNEARKTIKETLENLKPRKEQLEEIAQANLDAGKEVPQNIREGLSDIHEMEALIGQSDGIYAVLGKQIAESPEYFEAIKSAQANGEHIPKEIINSIELYSGQIYDETTNTWQQVTNATNDNAEFVKSQITNTGLQVSDSLIQSIAQKTPDVQSQALNLIQQISTASDVQKPQLLADLAALGIEVDSSLAQGLNNNVQVVRDSATGAITSLKDAAGNQITNITPQFAQMLANMGIIGVHEMESIVSTSNINAPNVDTSNWQNNAKAGRDSMQKELDRNPLSAVVNFVKKIFGGGTNDNGELRANGGIVTEHQLYQVAEGDKAEMIIPLSASKRSRAISLLNQTAGIIGAGTNNVNLLAGLSESRMNETVLMAGGSFDYDLLANKIADIMTVTKGVNQVTQNVTIHSPMPLSPAEIARLNRIECQKLVAKLH